ncbi:transporter [Streptomyces gamaensis]|uniref:Transporter n=1 Tax=Streptomyces gamaensis TaxID=1763542 RepID=A0ABW0Z6J6_9ACTN
MKGTFWLAWRQQRTAVVIGAVLLAACAAWVAFRRADMTAWLDSHHIGAGLCKGWDPEECQKAGVDVDALHRMLGDYGDSLRALGSLSAALPVIIGVFWGAPLVGRELESGTWKLALTQGVGVRRLFASRFALAAACALVGSVVLAGLVAWWWSPVSNMLDGLYWHDGFIFNATGPAAVACALFGLVAGTAAGVLLRRTLPAMGTALVAIAGLRLLLNTFRSDWISPAVRISQGTAPREYVGSAWSTGDFGFVRADGSLFPDPSICPVYSSDPTTPPMGRCMTEHGFTGRYHKVFPVGDFWAFQWIETAVYLGVAAVLFAGICVVLRRRPI